MESDDDEDKWRIWTHYETEREAHTEAQTVQRRHTVGCHALSELSYLINDLGGEG